MSDSKPVSDQDIEPAATASPQRVTPVVDPGLSQEARDHLMREIGRAENEVDAAAGGCGLLLTAVGVITLIILHFATGLSWWWMLASGIPVTIGTVLAVALGSRLGKDEDRVIRAKDLDDQSRQLMLRTQKAIGTMLRPREYTHDSLDAAVIEPRLRRHEWDIATSLRDISRLRAAHTDSAGEDAPGPMTAAVLDSQHRALVLAVDSVADKISKLERCAAEFEMADAAEHDWRAAVKASGRNEQYLDLVARTAADEHAIAEISDLAEQATAAVRAFREHLYQADLAARALVLPRDAEDGLEQAGEPEA